MSIKKHSISFIDYIKKICAQPRMWNLFGSLGSLGDQLSAEEYGVLTPQSHIGNGPAILKPNFEERDGYKTAKWPKNIRHSGWHNAHFYKAKCGDCWICGKPINFFLVLKIFHLLSSINPNL